MRGSDRRTEPAPTGMGVVSSAARLRSPDRAGSNRHGGGVVGPAARIAGRSRLQRAWAWGS